MSISKKLLNSNVKELLSSINDIKKRLAKLDSDEVKLDEYYRKRAEERKFVINTKRKALNASLESYRIDIRNEYGCDEAGLVAQMNEPDSLFSTAEDTEEEDVLSITSEEVESTPTTEPTVETPENPFDDDPFDSVPVTKTEVKTEEVKPYDPFEHLDDEDYSVDKGVEETDTIEEADRDSELGI